MSASGVNGANFNHSAMIGDVRTHLWHQPWNGWRQCRLTFLNQARV